MPAKSTFGSASVIPYTTSNPVYGISRSLRFNSADSAYLNKTLGSGSRTKFTYSLWFKRTSLTDAYLLAAYFSSTNQTNVQFSSDALQIFSNISGSTSINLITSQLFRDPSAWYHLVVSVDTTHATESNRVIAYLNGSQITSFSTSTYPSQNSNTNYGDSATPNYIGSYGAGSFFNGYITETYFIDGQALTPDSFGYIDSNTMVWQPKRYTGTYGTNGFYLNFSDNSSLTTSSNVGIGKDFSGNTNYWTTNGISINTGAGNDSLVDSPTNYGSDTGLGGEVRGNYSTLNVTDINSSIALVGNGNLEFTQNSNGTIGIRRSTIAITSGKWYFEAVPANVTAFSTQHTIGIVGTDHSLSNYVGSGANGYAYRPDGNKLNNGTATAYGTTTTANTDVIMVAFDADNWKIWFGKNGTWFASGDPVAGTNAAFSSITGGTYLFAVGSQHTGFGAATWITNFGQRPFAYTAPTGFKALCTQNLPQPTIQKPSTAMDVVTYTGNGSNGRVISGLNFSPDLVWTKSRSAAYDHALSDTVRGVGFALHSNTTAAEDTSYGLSGVGAGNYTINAVNQLNENTTTYVAWSWKAGSTTSTNTYGSITSTVRANPQAGFSIVSYTGNGTAGATVGHGLGVAPKMIIVKNRITAGFDWVTYHQNMNASPQGGYVSLNSTIAFTSNTGIWNNVAPSSSVFTLGTNTAVNKNAEGHIAYCFSEIEGYSKFGSYTGNGSSDGPFVWCGFRPRWVMYKRADLTENWAILDSARDVSNVVGNQLTPNSSSAEGTGSSNIDIVSNGFKMRSATAGGNVSNGTYIFAAFAESPFKYARAR